MRTSAALPSYEATPLALGQQGPGPARRAGVSVWVVDTADEPEAVERLARQVLDEAEWRRAGRFLHAADRRRYLAAHVGLRLVLGTQIGLPPARVRLHREPCPCCGAPHGRPAVRGGPHFSLSHSGSLALIACAPVPVGVDVERIPGPEVVHRVGPSLHPAETAELTALPPECRPAAFARAWTRTEAYLKGLGTGLARAPSLDHLGTGLTPAPAPPGWTVADLQVPEGHAAALAVRQTRCPRRDPR